MKKGSKAAKAWGAKMRRLRGSGTKRKKSTRKGQVRKTARRAYTKIKSKAKSYKPKKRSSGMKLPKIPTVIKKSCNWCRCCIFSKHGSWNYSASVCGNC